jgi:hypothetical protein
MIMSNHQADYIKTRTSRRLPILKALTGTSFGQCQETLLLTYKVLIRPVIDYGCPIWYLNASNTSVKKLQVVQNKALRTVIGCHLKTPIELLHTETGMLKVKDHLDLLSSQYLATAMPRIHPSHAVVTLPQGPRQMKQTLYSKCINNVQPHLNDGVMLEYKYKKSITVIHSSFVAKAICEAGPNPVLGWYSPSAGVHPEEETLTRAH